MSTGAWSREPAGRRPQSRWSAGAPCSVSHVIVGLGLMAGFCAVRYMTIILRHCAPHAFTAHVYEFLQCVMYELEPAAVAQPGSRILNARL